MTSLSLRFRGTSYVISRQIAQRSVCNSAVALGMLNMCQAPAVGAGGAGTLGDSQGVPPRVPLSPAFSLQPQQQLHTI